ncbi:MAG: glycosyltransferase family 4 protein [Candidatus Thermoplasmatota archaeon]|jgi:glycosyltransferase involved in cell wall biosynthesis|nr:glycosyltransferase family 4 protein [Candidatus Thermoplasmatota archaeon]MCL5794385.1 glycosyltransferase family 4 protein [Candidatus Thermoplasmatota archaeon]
MDMPRVLSVNEAFFPHEGGAEKRAYEILSRLGKRGFDVSVATNPFPGKEEVQGLDIEYITNLKESNYFKKNSRRLLGVNHFSSSVRKYVRDHRRDFDIFNFDEFPLIHALKGVRELTDRKTAFFTWHEVLRQFYAEKGFPWKIAASWEKQVSQEFRHHITVSSTISKLLSSIYSVHDSVVIQNGVNRKEFQNSYEKEWGKIVYVGRLEPHKRLDKMIEIFKKESDLQLQIIGAGSQLKYLKSMVNGNNNIKILGHVDKSQLLEEVKHSWLFVMPSYREGFSIASLEAMAASVPVLTVDSSFNYAANEIVRDGYNGIISSDFSDMITRIRGLYKDEDGWRAMSKNAYDFTSDYDWDNIADKLANLYLSSWSA